MQTGLSFRMQSKGYRECLVEYIRENARPPDKFSHQARLYALARELAGDQPYDDDVLHAAAWLHDLGVFVGHRPEDPQALAAWDHLAYVLQRAPGLLRDWGFPEDKIPAVLEAIRTHMPQCDAMTFEAVLLRDADILEQLGAVGILRTVSKVGRDTRFIRFSDAIAVLERNARELPAKLNLETARQLARPRVALLQSFLKACRAEAKREPW